jgi:hypothetical protein
MQALALTMKDPETVILMNDPADDYDRLADRAADGRKPSAQKASRARVPRNKVAVNTLALHEDDKRDCVAK